MCEINVFIAYMLSRIKICGNPRTYRTPKSSILDISDLGLHAVCLVGWIGAFSIHYTPSIDVWCAKKTCKYFLQFSIDIQQNVEWTRFLAHPVCVYSNDNEGGIKKCKIQIRLSLGKFKRPLWYIYRLFNVFPLNLASIQKSPQTHGYSSQSHTHPISIPMGMGIPIPTAALPTILVSTQPHPQQDRSE